MNATRGRRETRAAGGPGATSTGRFLGAAVVVLAFAPSPASSGDLTVETVLRPQRTFVHAQVELRVEVRHPGWLRPRWQAPVFEGVWPERLSTTVVREGPGQLPSLHTTVFRRALFPARPGAIDIGASGLIYEEPDGSERRAPVPGAQLQVEPLPETGRPAGFSGVVGRLEVSADLIRNPIARGESTRLLLEVFGDGNVWDLVGPSLSRDAIAGTELFAARPRLHVGEHLERITARRTFAWEVVGVREGRIRIPAFSVPYFDPVAGRYAVARSEPLGLEVTARGAASPFPEAAPPSVARSLSAGAIAWGLLVLLGGFGLAALFLARWSRRGASILRMPPRPRPEAALRRARTSVGTADLPARLSDALKAGIAARHRVDVRAMTTAEIAERIDDPTALDLLSALDRSRFAPGCSVEFLLDPIARYIEGS